MTSSDVNAYLREISGIEVTAKDFRTWAATWRAANRFAHLPPFTTKAEANKNIRAVIVEVAKRLGNTPTICRKSYGRPDVVTHYLAASPQFVQCRTPESVEEMIEHALTPEELGTLRLLMAGKSAAQ